MLLGLLHHSSMTSQTPPSSIIPNHRLSLFGMNNDNNNISNADDISFRALKVRGRRRSAKHDDRGAAVDSHYRSTEGNSQCPTRVLVNIWISRFFLAWKLSDIMISSLTSPTVQWCILNTPPSEIHRSWKYVAEENLIHHTGCYDLLCKHENKFQIIFQCKIQ